MTCIRLEFLVATAFVLALTAQGRTQLPLTQQSWRSLKAALDQASRKGRMAAIILASVAR